MATWKCVKQCGACCHLDPEERPEIAEYLAPEELELYLSMVGEGGWCINYDHFRRECKIYANRPRFCRVEPEIFWDMYGIEPEEVNDGAVSSGNWGAGSREWGIGASKGLIFVTM